VFKIAVAVAVCGVLVCVSDPAAARFRIRLSTPAKAATVQTPKPAAAAAATTSRPKVGTFVVVSPRPFAAAPRETQPHRATPALAEQAGAGQINSAMADDKANALPQSAVAAKEPAQNKEPAKAPTAAATPAAEPAKARPAPGFAPARLASTSVHVVNHKAQPARPPIYCYVQPSGACVPF
jgi:hypothetical protein